MDSSAWLEDIVKIRPVIESLFSLVSAFSLKFREEKRRRNLVDFADLGHLALRLLWEEDGEGNPRPTETARKLSEKYAEIFVDEYQERTRSRPDSFGLSRNGKNIFMVGDIKQASIVSARPARNFLRKYQTYSSDEKAESGARPLKRQFQERGQVVDFVNFVFGKIMSKEAGSWTTALMKGFIRPPAMRRTGRGLRRRAFDGGHGLRDRGLLAETGRSPSATSMRPPVARRIGELLESGWTVTDPGTREKREVQTGKSWF
jgi:hypothetical protein